MDRHNDSKKEKKQIRLERERCWEELGFQFPMFVHKNGTKIFVRTNPSSSNYVIIVHGLGSNAWKMSPYALHFYNAGWNVILMDFDMGPLSFIKTAISEIKSMLRKYCVIADKVLLFGQSIGASACIYAAKDIATPSLVIADCPANSILDAADRMTKDKPLLKWVNKHLFRKWADKNADKIPYAAELEMKTLRLPVLLISGRDDWLCPPRSVIGMKEGSAEYAALFGTHCRTMWRDPDTYWKTISNFILRNL